MQSAVVVVYGPAKRGKSTDFLFAAPTAIFLVPTKGNLESWAVLTGIAPREIECPTFDAVITILRAIHEGKRPKPSTIVLDDLSVMAERTLLAMDPAGRGGWPMWGALKRKLLVIRELCLKLGITLLMNAHEQEPMTDEKGVFHLGGPKLPSKSMSADFPHIAQLVLRVGYDPLASSIEWPGRYQCSATDPAWIMGDRYVVAPKVGPMNVREILRRAWEVRADENRPIVPPRAPGLEWLDRIADAVAAGLVAGATVENAAERLVAAAKAGKIPSKDPKHLRWAWRDGVDRFRIRTQGPGADLFAAFSPDGLPPSRPFVAVASSPSDDDVNDNDVNDNDVNDNDVNDGEEIAFPE